MCEELSRSSKIDSIVFLSNKHVSTVSTLGELLDEINNYKAFYLTNVGTYVSLEKGASVEIKPKSITYEMRKWLSNRMK